MSNFGLSELQQLLDRMGKSPSQVVLRWVLQRGVVALPRSANPKHMAENLDLFGFELGLQDMASIAAMASPR